MLASLSTPSRTETEAPERRSHDPATPGARRAPLRGRLLKGGRVVFNIGGNKYRVIVAIRYTQQIAWVRFVGTHAQYDHVEVLSILIEKYEDQHYPIGPSDPIEAIKFRMEQQGLSQRDLEPSRDKSRSYDGAVPAW